MVDPRFDPLAAAAPSSTSGPTRSSTASHPPTQIPTMTPEQQQYLLQQGVPNGMAVALMAQKQSLATSYWILDNGSGMLVRDAHILSSNYQDLRGATRWEELHDCVKYHSDLSARFGIQTRYALLNKPPAANLPQYFGLHQHGGNISQEVQIVQQTLSQVQPTGPTPLTAQFKILRDHITKIAPTLRQHNQTASVVLATQGLPTNQAGQSSAAITQEFVQTLQSFQGLPVSFVVRMCTDEDRAFDFYNGLDTKIPNLALDVLDDFYSEALEVYLQNPWLTYGLVLHRYREHGFPVAVLDAIDERALTLVEIRNLCYFLFAATEIPDPTTNWNGFLQFIAQVQAKERPHWNPITKSVLPWINLTHLNSMYAGGGGRGSYYAPRPTHNQPQPGQPQPPTQSSTFTSPPPPEQQHQQPSSVPPPMSSQPPPQPPTPQPDPSSGMDGLVRKIEQTWAKEPATNYQTNRSVVELLSNIGNTFKLLDESHAYFSKKPPIFAAEALKEGGFDVVKRAVRKTRFFLHPDRLPKDFNDQQHLLCKTLWDYVSDAWDLYEKENKQ